VLKSIDQGLLKRLRTARVDARAAAWRAGARPERLVPDIDATLVTAHSEKEEAAGNCKGGFGFHPLLCFLDGSDEGLAGLLRPGNSGSNTAQDHERVLIEALEQLPGEALDEDLLVRADIGGATQEFTQTCRDASIRFSVRYELTEAVRRTLLELPESAWEAALDAEGEVREGAWVAEVTESVRPSEWPEGTRPIVRRERPHPGAQLSFSDADGHRFTCFLTDQRDEDIAELELRQRGRARVEDRIRCAKDTGLENLPFHAFAHARSGSSWC
jgi:DDE family transposase